MSGVKYYRIKQGLSREKLAKITGISIPTLIKMENATKPGKISARHYRKVADALKVTIDDLIKTDFSDISDDFPKRSHYTSKTENLVNCIAVYRRNNMLTYERLAVRLGLTTRERARQICASEIPLLKHLATLAKYENISVEEFIQRYSIRR
jgi:transcriptional regulator with XRE-family HTH domain